MKARPRGFYRTLLSLAIHWTEKARISDALHLYFRIDSVVTSDKQRVAEEMGSYFSNITDGPGTNDFNQATSSTDFGEHCSIKVIMDMFDPSPIGFRSIGVDEVVTILKDVNPRKATGWGTLPSKAFKCGVAELVQPLTSLYNAIVHETDGRWSGKKMSGSRFI